VADELHLVRDILDKQLLDREGCRIGRADGIVLQPRKGRPPRVVGIESGPTVLAARLHPNLGPWVARLLRRAGPHAANPTRIPMGKILRRGIDLHLDVAATATGAYAVERWIATRVIGWIPGAGKK
jgi:hypothetical protein